MKRTLNLLTSSFWLISLFSSLPESFAGDFATLPKKDQDYVLRAVRQYHQELQLLSGPEKYDFVFQHFPGTELHRLFIDLDKQKSPGTPDAHLVFDIDEPGYYEGMRLAFEFLRGHVDGELDFEEAVAFHDKAVSGVHSEGESMKTGVDSGYYYGFFLSQATEEAIKDWYHYRLIYFGWPRFIRYWVNRQDPAIKTLFNHLLDTHIKTTAQDKFIQIQNLGNHGLKQFLREVRINCVSPFETSSEWNIPDTRKLPLYSRAFRWLTSLPSSLTAEAKYFLGKLPTWDPVGFQKNPHQVEQFFSERCVDTSYRNTILAQSLQELHPKKEFFASLKAHSYSYEEVTDGPFPWQVRKELRFRNKVVSHLMLLVPNLKKRDDEAQYNQKLTQAAQARLQSAFDLYRSSIRTAQSDDEVLAAIGILLRQIEIFHMFPDGNQRTVSFLLLNKLLLQHNFPPVILDDPSIFDGWRGTQELVRDIKKGFYNYLKWVDRNFSKLPDA